MLRAIKTLYGVGAETFEEILQSTDRGVEAGDEQNEAMDLNADDPEASVVKFVNQIIREAISERATDIHVEPLENDLRIRYRIDGILHEVAVPPHSGCSSRPSFHASRSWLTWTSRKSASRRTAASISPGSRSQYRCPRFDHPDGERRKHFACGCSHGRISSSASSGWTSAKRQSTIVRSLLAQPNGIVLVTGPTGSGKSTSLYSFLSSINSVQRRIITIEEPVEYRLAGVSQIDVKPEIGLTFAQGLRHILRQDPNVIMVGEIRDFETAEIAIRAAMTGHLVFSTLHTNDAVGGITRLSGHGRRAVPARFRRPRLHRPAPRAHHLPRLQKLTGYPSTISRKSAASYPPASNITRARAAKAAARPATTDGRPFTKSAPHGGMRRLIISKATGGDLKQRATLDGMETLRQDGWRRVGLGQTTVEEVVRVTQSDEGIAELEPED